MNAREVMPTVQLYMVDEVTEMIYDNEKLERYNELVSQLGLKGQKTVVVEGKSPIPFMPMNRAMKNIFETLCPRQENFREFSQCPIPVEILDKIALSVKEQYFSEIQVWYDDKSDDPIVVGIAGYWYQSTWTDGRNKEYDNVQFATKEEAREKCGSSVGIYQNTDKKYLIGRWADTAKTMKELKEMAMERYMAESLNDYEKAIKDCQRKIEDLKNEAFSRFN
jgi:hypothetical protein